MSAGPLRPTPRPAGRILSIGFPLPGVRVENYNFASAPSLFDFDAVFVDAASVSQLIEGIVDDSREVSTFAGSPVRLHPRHPEEVALRDLLARRAYETERLLARGGIIVLFAQPARLHQLEESAPASDQGWLGPLAPPLTAAEGTTFEVTDAQHPLASFLLGQQANISYRAHVPDENLPEGTHVFARSYGGAAIALEYAAGAGRIIVMPALRGIPSGDGRYKLSESLQAGIRRTLGVAGEGRAPHWIGRYPVPGLDARTATLKSAQSALDDAQRALDAASAGLEALARYQRLLWQEGRLGLDDAVIEALRLVGFDVHDKDPDNLELRSGGLVILLEIEGSDAPVDMAPHHRLRQRIERAIERRGSAHRGLIVVNGERHAPPSERSSQVTDSLRTAAEQMQYAICPTTLLFDAAVATLDGNDAATEAIRARLLQETGLLAETGDVQQDQDSAS